MLIKSYGLFWQASEIEWAPGKGKKGVFRLLGRLGTNNPGLRVADFRHMQGIYILYGNYGSYYVGLTREQGLGKRVGDHRKDLHTGKWDRFSWFGFQKVLERPHKGIRELGELATVRSGQTAGMIGDIEALLIRAMGLPPNKAHMNFVDATEWDQIDLHDVTHYLTKIGE